ncbi:MAG: AmmeMemoRadiSam system protein B [Aliishimia sp.]
MKRSRISLICFVCLLCLPSSLWAETTSRFLDAARDPLVIDGALGAETTVAQARITGVTIPHHILAADLMARGLRAASGGQYDHIILIGPDHFRSLTAPFGVLTTQIDTLKGPLPQNPTAIDRLNRSPLFEDVKDAPREHGIHAITPFLKALFPDTPVTMLTTATHSRQHEWDHAVDRLMQIATKRTLIVQSTDYSHFLPRHLTIQRDIETLGVIASNDPDLVPTLTQPAHLDSKASQYIQMRLQQRLHGATPVIVAHRDAHDYIPEGNPNGPTTSYIVTLYTTDPAKASHLIWPDQTRMVFGGDVFLDRGWRSALADDKLTPVLKDLTNRVGSGPFVINLEGVLLDERPAGTNPVQHFMSAPLAAPVLQRMGVTAANLANNHSHDLGTLGFAETQKSLAAAGIQSLTHGKVTELGGFALLPLTFRMGYFTDHPVIRDLAQLDLACGAQTTLPLIVLPHWGADYTNTAADFERDAFEKLAACGVAAVIGAHTHNPSPAVSVHGAGRLQAVFSMGNLLFDQTGDDVSGALVELRRFQKGTLALRLIPVPNYFETLK